MKKGPVSADFAQQFGRIALLAALWCGFAVVAPDVVFGKGSVVASPHNLSASGGLGKHGVKFEEIRICVFCHAPHNARRENIPAPLWSHELPSVEKEYTMYKSSTFDTLVNVKPTKPTGASRLCLSCHDGSIALNRYSGQCSSGDSYLISRCQELGAYSGPAIYMPTDIRPTWNPNVGGATGSDLFDDHPISFAYTATMAIQGQLVHPASLPPQIRLEMGATLQCTSCHDPHNNEFGSFLVINNNQSGSPLCMACHNNTGWRDSSHFPLQTPFGDGSSVFGCMNCHYSHNAPQPDRLLRNSLGMDNCITTTCHNNGTTPASANVEPVFAQAYHHPVSFYAGDHDENETLPAQKPHVECADCHNPHQANRTDVPLSSPPNIDGPLKGVRGVSKDTRGTVIATAEYEICFKCHSGGRAAEFRGYPPETPPNRVLAEPDEMKRFDKNNTSSYHPVTSIRQGGGASLLPAKQDTMFWIYCSDCHNSDASSKAGKAGPSGPHGSQYEHILIADYYVRLPERLTPPYTSNNFINNYALCFRCHDDRYIYGDNGNMSGFYNASTLTYGHATHVKDRGIPCFACHDPHGVPGTPDLFVSSHLINFSRDYAAGASVPIPTYTPSVTGGSCNVACHTVGGTSHAYTR